jgi:hypothetical protein
MSAVIVGGVKMLDPLRGHVRPFIRLNGGWREMYARPFVFF